MRFPAMPVLTARDATMNFDKLAVRIPTFVTSLPTNPSDQQEIYYLADATNGVIWHLRYRAASTSPYKWEFVGGSSLRAYKDGKEEQTLLSNAFVYQEVENAPSLTVPLNGEYKLALNIALLQEVGEAGATLVQLNLGIGQSAPSVTLAGVVVMNARFQATTFAGGDAGAPQIGLAAGTVLKVWMAGNSTIAKLWTVRLITIDLVPVRVG